MKKMIDPKSKIFKNFFKDCEIVMSAPNVFFYVGEHTVLRGTPSVVQAMPTRVYVGIKKGLRRGRKIDIKIYDNGKLETSTLTGVEPIIGNTQIDAYIKVNFSTQRLLNRYLNLINKLSIKVLSDIYPGSGANWSGAYSSALSACIYFYIIKEYTFSEINQVITEWSIGDNRKSNKHFLEVNSLAFFLETAFHGGSASGYGSYISLLGNKTPVIYKTGRREDSRRPFRDVFKNINNKFDGANETEEIIRRLKEIEKTVVIHSLPSIHFDKLFVVVLDTGKKKKNSTSKKIKSIFYDLKKDIEESIKIISEKDPYYDEFTKNLKDHENPYDFQKIWCCLDYYIINFIRHFGDFLEEGKTENEVKSIQMMNAVGHQLLAFGLDWDEFENLRLRFYAGCYSNL
jgi:mevalonate kinase